ncbi:MAG: hypothetical protein GY736_03415, partial [Sphingomonas sp.]|uniref:hypothetical protein n=1 Tax=Sphingomonas sp. TaxID=28214 RepID=UPI002590037A
IALLRAGPHPAGFLIPTLDSWFDTKLCVADLEPTIARLIRANLILRRGETLYPRRHARNLIIGVYGNLFRILADDMAQLVSLQEPSLLGTLKSYLTRREQEDREKQTQKDD